MKKILTILLTLIILFFISCGEDTKDNAICDPACKSWETCNEETETCKLTDGKCNEDKDCNNVTCNTTTHECETNQVNDCIIGHKVEGECGVDATDIHDLGVTTGTYPNQMLLNDGALYLVNSGDNAIQKINLDDLSETNPFISLPTDSNPYLMTIDNNNELFVTNLMKNSYSRAKLNMPSMVVTKTFDGEDSLKAPEGITVNDSHIFIANANYTTDENWVTTYNDGFITMIDKTNDTFIKKIPTTQKNPQRIFILNDKLYVINSGVIESDANYIMYPKSDSGIDILDLLNTDSGFSNIKIPFTDGKLSGFAGTYTLSNDNKSLYMASGTAPELYYFNIEDNIMLRNTDNPIIIDKFDTPTSVMLNLTTVENYLFVTNFNNDSLYVLDINNNYKVIIKADIGEDSNSMEGPQGIAYDKVNKKVYIFFGISKKLISIDVNL